VETQLRPFRRQYVIESVWNRIHRRISVGLCSCLFTRSQTKTIRGRYYITKSLQNVTDFKCCHLRCKIIQVEIKDRFNSAETFPHSLQNLAPSSLLSKGSEYLNVQN
jgi:hypothetical protein